MGKGKTTEEVGAMNKARVRAIRRRRTLIARGGRVARSIRQTLTRRTVPGTRIVHYEGGPKAAAYREYMMGVHRKRLAKRKQRKAQLPALRARARVKLPKLVSSMVGSHSNRKYGVYLCSGGPEWFPTKKARRDYINANTARIQWQW